MRVMQIPRFPRKGEILDLEHFLRTRLSQTVVLWPDQAIPLAGYMGWPNDTAARDSAVEILRQWADGSEVVPPGLGRIQHEWLRVADILSLHYDLVQGEHQKRRGGASIGKAITLSAAKHQEQGRWRRESLELLEGLQGRRAPCHCPESQMVSSECGQLRTLGLQH
jgi:hypothetical protein